MLFRFSDTELGILKLSFRIDSEKYGHIQLIGSDESYVAARLMNTKNVRKVETVLTTNEMPEQINGINQSRRLQEIHRREVIKKVYPNLHKPGKKIGYLKKQYSENIFSFVSRILQTKN